MKTKRLLMTVILSIAFGLFAAAQQLTVNLNQVPLEKILDAITAQTGYTFYYSQPTVNPEKIVSLNVKNMSVEPALEKLFQGMNIGYSISNKKVYLVEKSAQSISPSKNSNVKKKITGIVRDVNGEPIIGASILIKGSSVGTASELDGTFELEARSTDVLKVSCIGFDEKEIHIGEKRKFDIFLEVDAKFLEEVVVIGYGTVKKRDLSTAISSVKASDMENLPNTDFRQALAGKMPGVQIMQTSGDPEGNNLMVRVRGVSSATAGNDPLYIVDGVPVENGLSNLNPNDVESVEVLKDASAAAIYGSRGSNGVIIMTTKKGKTDKVNVTYDGSYGIQNVTKKIDMLNAYQYAQYVKDGHDAAYYDLHPGGSAPNGSRPESYSNYPVDIEPYLNGTEGLTDTDWQDAIFRTAKTTSHNLAISGKTSGINYFISGNYTYKEGIIINSDVTKYTFRVNLEGKQNKLKYGINFSPSFSKSDRVDASGAYTSEGIVQSALTYNPMWPIYNDDGSFNYLGNGYWRTGIDYQHNEILNPVALATLKSDVVERTAMTGRAFMGYDILKNLSFQTSLGYSYYSAQNDTYRSSKLPLLGKAYYESPSNPVGYSSAGSYNNWMWENQLTFDKKWNEHSLNAVLVQSAQKETYKGVNVTATDYPNDYIQTISGGTVISGSSKTTQWSLASYLARAQYSYKSIYMFSAAIRADGSSRFGKNNRWGYFPSASAAWRISGENFFKKAEALNFISDMKLRVSYGKTGNFDIGDYEHLSTMSTDNYIFGTSSGSLANGYKPSSVENPDLTWEKTAMTNVGIDLQLFKGFLGLTGEYYYANTTDMLLLVPIPHLTGYSTTIMNIGKVNNRGWEFTLTSQHTFNNGFSYSANANFATNANEVKALGNNDTPIISTGSVNHAYYITEVGKPIGSYYLLVQDGVFKNEDELKSYPHFDNTHVGDFRFVDVDKDGVLNLEKDRTIVGNYMPEFTYGFGGNASFKNFDLNLAFQGVYGNEILNLNRRYLDNMEGNVNGTTATLNRWVSETNVGDGNTNRANRKSTGYNSRTSTWHIEDGSYLRLQNAAFGYTIPEKLSKKFQMEKLRVYISAQNLFTWTKYSSYNPEVSLRTNSALTPGEDYGTYPLAKTYMFGLNITF